MPYPRPRNNIGPKINPWFAADVLATIQQRTAQLLAG